MKIYSAIVGCLLIMLLAGCRSMDAPPLKKGPPISLALQIPSDSAWWAEVTRRSVGHHDFMGEEVRLETFTRFGYDLRAVQRSRGGDTQFHLIPRQYEIDDWVVRADGSRSRPPEVEPLFDDLEATVLLHPITFSVTVDGRLSGIDGLTALEEAVASVISRYDLMFETFSVPMQHAWRRVFMAHIDDRPIRRHLQETYGILPRGAVRLGDAWRLSEEGAHWPHLKVDEWIRLIDRRGEVFHLVTRAEDAAAPGPGGTRYKGGTHGRITLDAVTALTVASEKSTYWKRRRGRVAWERFTMKTLEVSESVQLTRGSMATSPPLNAIHRFPFMEESLRESRP